MPQPKTSAQLLETAERRAFVYKKRLAGYSYPDIRDAAIEEFGLERLPKGWDERYAYKDIKRELDKLRDEMAEDTEKVRTMEVERLDRMLKALWPKIESGDTKSIGKALRISSRRADLLGLDAPTQISNITKNIDLSKLSNKQLERLANGEDVVSVLIDDGTA